MLCFAKYNLTGFLQACYGSPFNYDKQGLRDGDFSLQTWGSDGIFNKFYKEMDSFYRHSNMILHSDMLLTESQKNGVSEIEPVLINNQVLLPDTIAYTVGRRIQKKCIFRTIKLYEPYDTEEEQAIPEISTDHTSALYFWEYRDNSNLIVPPTQGLDDYNFRLAGEIVRPATAPSAQQYLDSQQGVIFFENSVDIVIEHFVMSNLVEQIPSSITYWYVVIAK